MIDDESFPRAILGFKVQAKLLLERREKRRPRRIARRRAITSLLAASRSVAHAWRPLQLEIIIALKAGLILDDAAAEFSR